MLWISGLPHGLLSLLLVLPAFSNGALHNISTTSNSTCPPNPFHELRLRANAKPADAICCLTPLTTEPLPTTAEFLSFEEWKSKQRELQAQAQAGNQTPSPDIHPSDSSPGPVSVPSPMVISDPDSVSMQAESTPLYSPHFRVPLTDRFNYASDDCSARIHTSHHTARSPAAILSSKKDRYMLSPCSAHPNFVIVELCDDIRIDTVQLANFEFFSGVFRDFKVSVAQTYTSDSQGGWIEAGTYQAKNVRRVQSFHPLVELRPFYRFIRIDFLSHYGNEFYCPISLLRVYGLTQMEEWKWEVWQSGSENVLHKSQEIEDVAKVRDGMDSANGTVVKEEETQENVGMLPEASAIVVNLQTFQNASNPHSQDSQTFSSDVHPSTALSPAYPSTSETSPPSQSIMARDSEVSRLTTTISPLMTSEVLANSSTPPGTPHIQTNATGTIPLSNLSHSGSSPSSSSVQSSVSLSSSSMTSGDSIYRTIMKRLAMLETNTTLYQQYVEEQTLQVRDALRRLEENVGRLEGISKSQQQFFSKTMQDLELRRKRTDEERWELLNKVNHLADEVVLEKRLGIAQLCLLLTVLVFMALTRGSRVNLLDGTMHRLNSFSHRRVWSSTDWSRKLSRSRTPTRTDYATSQKEPKDESRDITISRPAQHEKGPIPAAPFPTTPPAKAQTPRSVSRPTTPRRHDMSRTPNESRPLGRLRRSNSHTTPASAALSAKRFARTAHLHEVPLFAKQPDMMGDGVFDGVGDASPKPKRGSNDFLSSIRLLGESPMRTNGAEESDAGSWVSTDRDFDSDSEGAEPEEGSVQQIELKPDFDFRSDRTPPVINAPPSGRKGSFEGHIPPSPASLFARGPPAG